ncbi:hypothetical protein B0T18DRAFT_385581 [Schizothecium vesticola]|uniref:Uncharacterized protein n=1 Tax=Schizothecium vesticola TaxID=314040 RepID=A0AA40KBW6_9PEZI|nr:hypothetical protein B0T18DRAFT_385581 [Schizothecium vesticola]
MAACLRTRLPRTSDDREEQSPLANITVPLRRWAEISLRYASAKKPMPLRVVAACVYFDHANTRRAFDQGAEPLETVHEATFGGSACKKSLRPTSPTKQSTHHIRASGDHGAFLSGYAGVLRNSPLHEKKMEELSKNRDETPLSQGNEAIGAIMSENLLVHTGVSETINFENTCVNLFKKANYEEYQKDRLQPYAKKYGSSTDV